MNCTVILWCQYSSVIRLATGFRPMSHTHCRRGKCKHTATHPNSIRFPPSIVTHSLWSSSPFWQLFLDYKCPHVVTPTSVGANYIIHHSSDHSTPRRDSKMDNLRLNLYFAIFSIILHGWVHLPPKISPLTSRCHDQEAICHLFPLVIMLFPIAAFRYKVKNAL